MRFFHHLAQFVSHKKPPTPADRSPTVHRQFTDSLKNRKMRHHHPISCFGGGSHGATPPKMRFHQVMSQFTADRSPTVHRHFTDCLRYCQKTLKIHTNLKNSTANAHILHKIAKSMALSSIGTHFRLLARRRCNSVTNSCKFAKWCLSCAV